MRTDINDTFLCSVVTRLNYYKVLAEKAFEQLADEQLFIVPQNDGNSIAMIVQHMAGNMISRWTDFLTTDGEKEWRMRDSEFETVLKTKAEMLHRWNEGWDCVFTTLKQLKPNQLMDIIYIRKEPLTVVDAINRQLAHYPYHVGQIVFYAKILKHTAWSSLSMPKKK
jgi:uncharacterized damage-inducible protein DinB